MTEAQAAVRAARGETFTESLGDLALTFLPELPVDVVLAYDDLKIESVTELEAWTVAHLLSEPLCDTSCADSALTKSSGRVCPAEQSLRQQLRKARVDGRRPTQADLTDFHTRVLGRYEVTQGESEPSADLPAATGAPSTETASTPASTSQPSSDQGAAARTGS